MEPNSGALSLTRSDEPGQLFEMIVYRYPNGQATVNVVKVGKLTRRNVAVRDASEPPRWAASGDVLEFADEVWIPMDHDAAVAWMNELDGSSDDASTMSGSSWVSPPSASDVSDASSVVGGGSRTARARLGSAAALVQVAGAIIGVLSIAGGVILVLHRDDFDEQPFVGAGIGSIVSGVVFWTFAYFAGMFAEAWLETTERP